MERVIEKSIWFGVDLVSCLPIISSLMEVLSNIYNFGLEGTRAARGARFTNIVRASRMTKVSRMLKSLRLARGINVFKTQHFEPDEMPTFETALKITIPILIASFLVISCYFEFFFNVQNISAGVIQGCLLLLVLFTATVSIYISQSFSRDQSNSQQLNVLRRFFSPRMIETLEKNEDLIERYYQRWLSVFLLTL